MLNINPMFDQIRNKLASIPSRIFWICLFSVGILIIILNDAFGDYDSFIGFSLCYFLFLGIVSIRWIFSQVKSILALKRDKAKMEMLHLKSQVSPHFFFNTLNNLYGLVDKDPQKARNLILKLSDLMRYSIYEGQNDWMPLEDEIDYLKNYVDLHKDRYHKKVEIDFETSIEKKGYRIMPLLLILLVENAFKHGVEKLIEGAYVKINIVADNENINFKIVNNFEIDGNKSEKGIGIENLKRRLQIGYPKTHELSFQIENGVYQAQLMLQKI